MCGRQERKSKSMWYKVKDLAPPTWGFALLIPLTDIVTGMLYTRHRFWRKHKQFVLMGGYMDKVGVTVMAPSVKQRLWLV